jgi:hypothetical protein
VLKKIVSRATLFFIAFYRRLGRRPLSLSHISPFSPHVLSQDGTPQFSSVSLSLS